MTHKIAMRRRLAEAGVPQPRFAAVRSLHEGRAALDTVGLPAVLKPADSGGQRGLFLLRSRDDLDAHLHAALAESPGEEAIVESYHDGLELNGLALARGGDVVPLTLSDRLRPPGIGFGVGWIHVYPARIYGDVLDEAERVVRHAVHALGLRNGIAFPQLLVDDDGRALVVEVAARIPGGQMADLARPRGRDRPRGDRAAPGARRRGAGRARAPSLLAAARDPFLTAEPGPLPTGIVRRWSGLERVLAFPGVVQADVFLLPGETIRPVRLDGDRRGYVIAVADTNVEALERAEAAAGLIDVELEAAGVTCGFHLEHYRELPRRGARRRLPLRAVRPGSPAGRPARSPRRRSLAGRRPRAGRRRGGGRRDCDVLPDDAVRLLQPRLGRG